MKKFFACLTSFFVPAAGAYATPITNVAPKEIFVGARPAALGSAFTSIADDQNALYYNPAGLARLEAFSLEIINPSVGANGNLVEAAKTVSSQSGSLGGADTSKNMEAINSLIGSIKGKNNWTRIGINPNFVRRNFGLSILQNNEINATLPDPAPSLIEMMVYLDTEARVGYAQNFFDKKLAVGAAVSFLHRVAVEEKLDLEYLDAAMGGQEKIMQKVKGSIQAGQSLGADVGVLFTPVQDMEPTLGLAIQNLGDRSFMASSVVTDLKGGPKPRSLAQSVNVGLSAKKTWGTLFLRPSADMRAINQPIPAGKKLALGVEAGWSNHFRFQAGLGEGYPSFGFETRLWLLNFRYASYVTEVGLIPGQRSERRHLINTKILF